MIIQMIYIIGLLHEYWEILFRVEFYTAHAYIFISGWIVQYKHDKGKQHWKTKLCSHQFKVPACPLFNQNFES